MKKSSGRTVITICLAAAFCSAGDAGAVVVPVIDAANLISNVVQNYQLAAIKRSLAVPVGGDTINNHTNNIDNSTSRIDVSITKNTEINTEFTWVINKGGDEVVPIPGPVNSVLQAVMGTTPSKDYSANFQSADHYLEQYEGDAASEGTGQVGMEGSRARKAANDALVSSIEAEQVSIAAEAQHLEEFFGENSTVAGHGRQLQVANALANAQADQLMKLRSMMLVSDAVRAAEAQSAADKEARAMAASKAMRKDISKYTLTAPQAPVF